jgi:transposase
MARALSSDLRERPVMTVVVAGASCRSVVARFAVVSRFFRAGRISFKPCPSQA